MKSHVHVVEKRHLALFGCLFLCVGFFVGCSKKRSTWRRYHNVALCITTPKSTTAYHHVAPLVYDALYRHFARVGCTLVSRVEKAASLHVTIIQARAVDRFVSPDVIPYASRLQLELLCTLYDRSGTLRAKKSFQCATWSFRPSSPLRDETYRMADYAQLLERLVPRIEHYLRRYLHDENA